MSNHLTREMRLSLSGQTALVCLLFSVFFLSAGVSSAVPDYVSLGARIVPGILFLFLAFLCFTVWLRTKRAESPIHLRTLFSQKQDRLFFLLAVLYIVFLCFDAQTAPVWDAGLYYSALLNGVFSFDFTLSSFFMSFSGFRHPTQALMLLYAPAQYLFPGSVLALNLTTLALGLACLFLFYRFCIRLFLGNRSLALFAAILYACSPLVLSFTHGINPDYGMLLGLVLLLHSYAYTHPVGMVCGGLLLLFSKEPGLVLYGGFGLGMLLYLWQKSNGKPRVKNFFRQAFSYWYLLIPFLFFGLYSAVYGFARIEGTGGFSALVSGPSSSFQWNAPHILTILLQVFVFQFGWLFTLLFLAALLKPILQKKAPAPLLEQNNLFALLGSALAYAIFVFAYVEIDLARYLLPFAPALAALLSWAVWRLFAAHKKPQKAICLLLCGLFFFSSIFSFDPVSLATFSHSLPAGTANLFNITRNEAYLYLCEVTVYNRQYLSYSRLLDKVAGQYGAGNDVPYLSVGIPSYSLQFFGNEQGNYRLSYSPQQERRVFYSADAVPLVGQELILEEGATLGSQLPQQFRLLVPAFQPEGSLDSLWSAVTVLEEETITAGGSSMHVYLCERT